MNLDPSNHNNRDIHKDQNNNKNHKNHNNQYKHNNNNNNKKSNSPYSNLETCLNQSFCFSLFLLSYLPLQTIVVSICLTTIPALSIASAVNILCIHVLTQNDQKSLFCPLSPQSINIRSMDRNSSRIATVFKNQ